jgi:hypothetical protein
VRYADDATVMCWSRSQAERALERLTALLAGLGLEPKAAKTRIVHLQEGGEGFDFLGFHHRLVRSRGLNGKRPVTFLARWPADKAIAGPVVAAHGRSCPGERFMRGAPGWNAPGSALRADCAHLRRRRSQPGMSCRAAKPPMQAPPAG